MASPATRPTARCATGNRAMAKEPSKPREARWPFDPMQPGDHEPVRLPEAPEHLRNEESPPPNRSKQEKQR